MGDRSFATLADGGGFFLDCPRALAPTLLDFAVKLSLADPLRQFGVSFI